MFNPNETVTVTNEKPGCEENDTSTIQWQTEIRGFLGELRAEIRAVRTSLVSDESKKPSNSKTECVEDRPASEPDAVGALDRLEMLKRRLNERLQSQEAADTNGRLVHGS